MASIQKRKTKRGTKYRVQVRRTGHRSISKVFNTKKEADAWARLMDGNSDHIDAYPDAEARRRRVADAIDAFMLEYAGRDGTLPSRLAWWKTHHGHHTLAGFTQPRIREGLRQLAGEKVNRGDGKGKSKALDRTKSASTVNRYLTSISSVLRWTVEEGWLPRNPAHGIQRRKEPAGIVRWLDEDERKALLGACDKSEWADLGLLVRLALSTGARQSELMNLRWEDLDLQNGLAHVGKTKNDEPRMLPLIASVRETLKKKTRPIKGGLLFPSPAKDSKPFEFRKHWDAAVKAANLKEFRFHDLRHSCASYMAMAGLSPLEIGDMLGHRTLVMVRRYSHLSTDHKKQLAERVLGGMVE